MLQTLEAIYDPQKGLVFSETLNITAPIKVLVTFMETSQSIVPSKGSAQSLLTLLKIHALPKTAQISDVDIDAQVQELSQSWNS